MSTDIVTVDRAPSAALTVTEAVSLAEHFARSGYFRDASDVSKAVVKIMAGAELGIGPLSAMTGIHIVEGKPALSAGLVGALVLRSGRYTYTVRESTDTACVLSWQRDGRDVGESAFTLDDAKRAGVAGKQNWARYPSDMLFARALTRGARRFCPDVFLGAVYVPEELGADVAHNGEVIDVTPTPALPTPAQTRQEPSPATNGHQTPAPAAKGKARKPEPATQPAERTDTVLPDDHPDVVLLVTKIDAITDAEHYDAAVAYLDTLDPRLALHPLVVAALERARTEVDAAAMDWAGPVDGGDGDVMTAGEELGEAMAAQYDA